MIKESQGLSEDCQGFSKDIGVRDVSGGRDDVGNKFLGS